MTAISVNSSVTEPLHLTGTVLENRDCVVPSGRLHLAHLPPHSVDGVELQDFINRVLKGKESIICPT